MARDIARMPKQRMIQMGTGVDIDIDMNRFMAHRKSGDGSRRGSRMGKMAAAIKQYRESNQADNNSKKSQSSSDSDRGSAAGPNIQVGDDAGDEENKDGLSPGVPKMMKRKSSGRKSGFG